MKVKNERELKVILWLFGPKLRWIAVGYNNPLLVWSPYYGNNSFRIYIVFPLFHV